MRKGAGRPPKPRDEKQGQRIALAFTEGEVKALREAAAPVPVATYLRDLALRHLARRRGGR